MAVALPNLFTLSGMFCGFWAVVLAADAISPRALVRAELAIFFGIFFDMADGRVARLTRSQSAFGTQMDSLADVVTFGVAPAFIAHRWALAQFGAWGAAAAFFYIACGTMRLARFNVLANSGGHEPRAFFVGLPIPLAAGLATSWIMVQSRRGATHPQASGQVAALLVGLGMLMVSRVRYRTFKDVAVNRASKVLFVAGSAAFLALAWALEPPLALLSLFSGYVGMGLVETLLRRIRGPKPGRTLTR